MSISLNVHTGHAGRPARGFHHHHPRGFKKGPIVLREHISRHKVRGAGRFHFHRPRNVVVLKSHATIPVSGTGVAITSILAGIASLITSVALIAFGALIFNPVVIGVGVVLGAGGIALTAAGGIYLGNKFKK